MTWQSEDPRHTIYKRSRIIAIKPNIAGHGKFDIGIGEVETHHGYSVTVSFDKDFRGIYEGDDWDRDWKWIRWPGGADSGKNINYWNDRDIKTEEVK